MKFVTVHIVHRFIPAFNHGVDVLVYIVSPLYVLLHFGFSETVQLHVALQCPGVPFNDHSSHVSQWFDCFSPSPHHCWYATHVVDVPFALLHVHCKWASAHTILGFHTVNHAAHIHADVAVNHGIVCFVEKYVLHLSFVPHETGFALHVVGLQVVSFHPDAFGSHSSYLYKSLS